MIMMKRFTPFLMTVLLFMFGVLCSPASFAQEIDFEKRLTELNIELIPPTKPVANFVKAVRVGNLLYVSGHGSRMKGKVGADLTVEQGYEAAKETCISILSTVKAELGDLNKIKRLVKVLGMVNATDDFTDHPKVINGFSDLMVAVFGENGKHARSAVGMNSLPGNIAVEIEVIIELK
jgi:enamine deaminase RidA (YjgF/YER057c/UK114 family)